MAEWARLLSECWVKPVAGSNPALPATKKYARFRAYFFVSAIHNNLGRFFTIPLDIISGRLKRADILFTCQRQIRKQTSKLKQER